MVSFGEGLLQSCRLLFFHFFGSTGDWILDGAEWAYYHLSHTPQSAADFFLVFFFVVVVTGVWTQGALPLEPLHQLLLISCCVLTWWKAEGLSCPFGHWFMRDLSWTNLIPSHWGYDFNAWILGSYIHTKATGRVGPPSACHVHSPWMTLSASLQTDVSVPWLTIMTRSHKDRPRKKVMLNWDDSDQSFNQDQSELNHSVHLSLEFEFYLLFFFLTLLEFELRISCLLGRHFILEPFWQPLSVLGIFKVGSCQLFAWAGFKLQSSWSLPPEQLGLQVWATGAQLEFEF
jgi:hypothetical protein